MKSFDLSYTNEYCLDSLLSAASAVGLYLKEEVYDEPGTKLLEAGQSLSSDIKDKLRGKKLKKPIETSIGVKNAITPADISDEAIEILKEFPLFSEVFSCFERDAKALGTIYLGPIPALFLSVIKNNSSKFFRHTVLVALIARIIGTRLKLDYYDMALLSQAALVHDIGELYVDPSCINKPGRLTPEEWKSTMAHCKIGEMLISQYTSYAPAVARAVGEHHERADGTGYPMKLHTDQISQLGNILIVSELLAGVLAKPNFPISRGLLVMHMVPGEYPADPLGVVHALLASNKVKLQDEDVPFADAKNVQAVIEQLDIIIGELTDCRDSLSTLVETEAVEHALKRTIKIKRAMISMGMEYCFNSEVWTTLQEDSKIRFEMNVAAREIAWRLRDVSRDMMLHFMDIQQEPSKCLQDIIEKMSQVSVT